MMLRCRWLLITVLLATLAVGDCTLAYWSLPALRLSSRGPEVVLLQDYLVRLGYLPPKSDGIFGPQTEKAVRRFQRDEGLQDDGIVGAETWKRLRRKTFRYYQSLTVRRGDTLWDLARDHGVSVEELARVNGLADPSSIRPGQLLQLPGGGSSGSDYRPELVLWEEVNSLFPHMAVATVVDVKTRLSFHVRRYYGHFHADVEPLTEADTKVLRAIYGGRFSWERRAIIVNIKGRRIAASMNGYPHGGSSITNNGFDGHFCIHFLGSRLHLDGTIHRSHQEKVLEAAGYRELQLWFEGDRTR